MTTRKTLKFLHTIGSIGFCGALAALVVLHASLPEPQALEGFATIRIAMGTVARWILLPSMALVVVSGLLSMAVTTAYLNAGWVWIKLLSGIIVFEGTLVSVQGPVERGALGRRWPVRPTWQSSGHRSRARWDPSW